MPKGTETDTMFVSCLFLSSHLRVEFTKDLNDEARSGLYIRWE
jgi:hypothetical protein